MRSSQLCSKQIENEIAGPSNITIHSQEYSFSEREREICTVTSVLCLFHDKMFMCSKVLSTEISVLKFSQ
jgi:hypothetical protein